MNPLMEAEETALNAYERNMAGASTRKDEVASSLDYAKPTPAATIYRYQKPIETVPLVRLYA